MTSFLWLPLFSSTTGEIPSSFFLPVFPPPPASWCLQKSEGRYVPDTELLEIIYLQHLSGSSFFHPAQDWHLPHPSGPGSLRAAALSNIDPSTSSQAEQSLHSYLNVYFRILPLVCLCRVFPAPSFFFFRKS